MHFPQFCKKHIGLLLILSMLIGYFVPQFGLLKPILPYLLILMLYNSLLPIEIKSGSTGRMKSMHMFIEKYGSKKALKISQAPFNKGNTILSIPFFSIESFLKDN